MISDLTSVFRDLGWSPFFHQQLLALHAEAPDFAGCVPARVSAEQRGRYLTFDGTTARPARLAGRLRHELGDDRPCVGDFVLLRPEQPLSRIEHLFDRKSLFQRTLPGGTSRAQAIAANVDVAFVVCALSVEGTNVHVARRGLNPRRIERYLRAIQEVPALGVVLLNKADLCPDGAEQAAALARDLGGADVLLVSAHDGDGLDAVRERIGPGDTAVLVGSSGVGKSSLTNRLLGNAAQRVEAERDSDGRGRHTTTERELFRLASGGVLIDTPGMRELALFSDGEDDPDTTGFDDVDAFAEGCRFRDCRHDGEPGCAVLEAVQGGSLPAGRVEHARKLQRELRWQQSRHDHRVRDAQRKASKILVRAYRATKDGDRD